MSAASMSTGSTATIRPRRCWATRALPICLVMLTLLVLSSMVLVDVVVGSSAQRSSWLLGQDSIRQWLERQTWDGLVTLIVCGVIAACGAIAVVAALVPGQRDLLPMWSPDRLTVGYLSAHSAAAALSTSALNVDHVLSAHVRLDRHRARVVFRTAAATRVEYDAVVTAVNATLQRRFASFGLVRPVRLRVKPRKFRPRTQEASPLTTPAPVAAPEPSDIDSERVSTS